MAVPENNVYVNGGAAVDGDALNTFIQTCSTMSDLRAFIGTFGMQVSVLGQNAVNDRGGGTFYWNATGAAADDNGVTTVVPSGAGTGEWTRLTLPVSTRTRLTNNPANPTGTTSGTPLMMGASTTFVPTGSGNFLFIYNGQAINTTLLDGCSIQIRYGTGTPPTNGLALQGSLVGQGATITSSTANASEQFSMAAYVAGLTIGTQYWIDVALATVGGGTASVGGLSVTIIEL